VLAALPSLRCEIGAASVARKVDRHPATTPTTARSPHRSGAILITPSSPTPITPSSSSLVKLNSIWAKVGVFYSQGFHHPPNKALKAEVQVFQVGINFADATKLTGTCAAELAVRRTPDAGRCILTDAVANGPAMFNTICLDQASGVDGRLAAATGLQTASLDEVLCIATIGPPPRAVHSGRAIKGRIIGSACDRHASTYPIRQSAVWAM
jgi:hypothetical protein